MILTSIFSLHTLVLLLTTTTAATAAISCSDKTATATCTTEVVSFSACLPYTAMPPNNLTSSASSDCCDNFSGILAASKVSCLCSLLGEPPIFGFPLNITRILSLSSVCPLQPELKNLTIFRNYTLQSFCSEASPSLPSPVQEYQNRSDCDKLSPGPSAAPPSFGNTDSKPPTDRVLLPPPSQPRGFHLGSFQVSSATRITKPWSWILPIISLSHLLSICPVVQPMLKWFW